MFLCYCSYAGIKIDNNSPFLYSQTVNAICILFCLLPMLLLLFFSVQIHETAYQRAAQELAAVKKELVELKVLISAPCKVVSSQSTALG